MKQTASGRNSFRLHRGRRPADIAIESADLDLFGIRRRRRFETGWRLRYIRSMNDL